MASQLKNGFFPEKRVFLSTGSSRTLSPTKGLVGRRILVRVLLARRPEFFLLRVNFEFPRNSRSRDEGGNTYMYFPRLANSPTLTEFISGHAPLVLIRTYELLWPNASVPRRCTMAEPLGRERLSMGWSHKKS